MEISTVPSRYRHGVVTLSKFMDQSQVKGGRDADYAVLQWQCEIAVPVWSYRHEGAKSREEEIANALSALKSLIDKYLSGDVI